MLTLRSIGDEPESIRFLELRIREIEAKKPLDAVYWKSLKIQLATTLANSPADMAAKLRVVHSGVEFSVDAIDLKILESAIIDLESLIKIDSSV